MNKSKPCPCRVKTSYSPRLFVSLREGEQMVSACAVSTVKNVGEAVMNGVGALCWCHSWWFIQKSRQLLASVTAATFYIPDMPAQLRVTDLIELNYISRLCNGCLTKQQSGGVLHETRPPQSPDIYLTDLNSEWSRRGYRLSLGCWKNSSWSWMWEWRVFKLASKQNRKLTFKTFCIENGKNRYREEPLNE